jgi:outer membrane immunogenic protein
MRIAIIAASAALLSVSAAHAGGLYDKGSLKDTPSYVETATPKWGGLYIGGSVGFGEGDTSDEIKRKRDNHQEGFKSYGEKHGEQFEYDVDGAIYGIHAGYNWQRGNLVYGLEAGFNGTDIDGSTTSGKHKLYKRELDWYGTGVARIGYAPGNTMFYGFGGIAWGEVNTNVSCKHGYWSTDTETTHVGWTAGLGIEHALSDRFSVRVEYSHIDLGEEDTTFSMGREGRHTVDDEVDLSINAIKVGASYKLTGSDAPLK